MQSPIIPFSDEKTILPPPIINHECDIIIQYNDPEGDTLYWKAKCSFDEFILLNSEINNYNHWIELLEDGLAPLSSYEDGEEDANNLMIAKDRKYQNVFSRPSNRGYYEQWGHSFSIYNLTAPDLGDDINDIIEELEENKIKNENISTLIEIITNKYSGYDSFGMGYRILPMTQKLLNEQRFN